MSASRGAGPLPSARGGAGPQAVAIAPPLRAPEHPILQRVRGNRLLDQIRHSDSPQQVRRVARLMGDMAAITSVLTMNLCDIIFRFYSGQPDWMVRQRHSTSLQAIEIINELCAQPHVLREWGFPEEHCRVATLLLGNFTGFAGVQYCPPDPPDLRAALPQPAQIDEAPFINSVLFLMLSKDFPALTLAQCLSRARFGTWSADYRTFFPEQRPGQGLQHRWAVQTTRAQDLGTVRVTFLGSDIDSFHFEEAWPRARFRHKACRHFMSERFMLPAVDDTQRVKIFRTVRASDGLQHAKPFWHRYFGTLAAELETILDGTFTVAKNGLPLRPIFQRNHPSWENDEYAQKVLIPVIVEWHNAGSLEYVERFHRLPHCILAVGAVPKNSPPLRRLVTDARPINKYAEKWRVKYATVQDICLMLTLCALMWVRDLCNAYHLVRLGGCRGRTQKLLRWITNPDGTGYVPAPTFRSGCGPGDCLGLCDKSMFGLCVDGHVSRFAVCQFGHKVSNGPLWVLTNTVCSYTSRQHDVDTAAFVDDLLNALAVLLHEQCGGLEGNCPICTAAFERARTKMAFLDRMMKDCGLEYSLKGDMRILQRHLFIGIIFDTLKGRLFIAKEKFDKTIFLLRDMMHQSECSPREMAKLRGKFGHQFRCVEGVDPFLVPFNQFVGGPETVAEWDAPKVITPALQRTMGTLFDWLPRLYEAGAEMWPLDPRTVLYKWTRGIETPGGPLLVVYWDSSPLAAGISIRREPDKVWRTGGMTYQGATTIATFRRHLEHQAHRESAGAPLAMQILRSLTDIRGHRVLFVNDCLPVTVAMRKGSPSPELQADAEYMALASLEAGCKSLYLHIPGTDMIAAGVDGASRDGAKRIVGPACSEEGRAKIRGLLEEHGWIITIDLFAATCNRMATRFASWTDEPESEAVDAFTLPSWDESVCKCGKVHRETAFIFPPHGLEKAAVRRAKSDRVRAVFVVPTAYKAGYWEALRGRAKARMQLDNPASDFARTQAPLGDHTVFLVDFGASDTASPACGQECEPRGRRKYLEPIEQGERLHVKEELRRLAAEQVAPQQSAPSSSST